MQRDHQDVPYAAIFAATPAPLVVVTPEFVIEEANRAYLDVVGRSREELVGRYMLDVFPEDADPAGHRAASVRASMERARRTGRPHTMVLQRYDIPAGGGRFEERYWSLVHAPVLDEAGRTVLLLQRAEDVTDFVRQLHANSDVVGHDSRSRRRTQEVGVDFFVRARELQRSNEELRAARDELAVRLLHDSLTGLSTRTVMMEQLSRALSRMARKPRPIAVLFIDVDRFKQVNDTWGHPAGDDLLRCFAEHLRASVRPSDLVARFGGDEFVILLEELQGVGDAEAVAVRVLEAVRACHDQRRHLEGSTASVGVALADCDVSAETLISHADGAMYLAKSSGGDGYVVFR